MEWGSIRPSGLHPYRLYLRFDLRLPETDFEPGVILEQSNELLPNRSGRSENSDFQFHMVEIISS